MKKQEIGFSTKIFGATLQKDDDGYYWIDGYCTSQTFPSESAALEAMNREVAEMERRGLEPTGLASAGIIEWSY